MKKIVFISFIIIFSLTGCFSKNNNENESDLVEGVAVKERKLLDWFTNETGSECVIDSVEGEIKIISSGKDKIRMEGIHGMQNAQSAQAGEQISDEGYMIVNGNMIYIWSGTQGMKFDQKIMEEMEEKYKEEGSEEETPDYDWEEMVKTFEENNVEYSCSKKKPSDSMFLPPEDVIFQDLTEMLQLMDEQTEMIEKQFNIDDIESPEDAPNFEEWQEKLENMSDDDLEALKSGTVPLPM